MLISTVYCFALLLPASGKHEECFTDHLLFNIKNNSLVHLQLPVQIMESGKSVFPKTVMVEAQTALLKDITLEKLLLYLGLSCSWF